MFIGYITVSVIAKWL